jgi:hypothetical protein
MWDKKVNELHMRTKCQSNMGVSQEKKIIDMRHLLK